MVRFSRRPARRSGATLLLVVLLMMLGVSGVLAWEAYDAARSEVRFGERVLREEASFAAWTLARGADDLVRDSLGAALAAGSRAASDQSAPRDAAAAFEVAARRRLEWCGCPAAVRAFFAVPLTHRAGAERDLRAAGLDRAVAARVLADGATGGGTGEGSPRVRVLGGRGGEGGVAFAVVPGVRGQAPRVLGFAFDAGPLARTALRTVMDGVPLLPPTLQREMGNHHAFRVVAIAPRGDTLFASAPAHAAQLPSRWRPVQDERIGAATRLPATPEALERGRGTLAGVTLQVAVRPEVAGRLVAGGVPRSRLPLLVGVFLLALGLVAVATVQLRRQGELERLRDDFVSGVSHELRTPLAQIRLFADLLESGRLRTGAQEARSVRIINEEARRLTYLVENVLHFSRAQRRSARVTPELQPLGPLVREIVDSFAPLARGRGVELVAELADGVEAPVDRDALRQVLLNLLDNAVKYGPRGEAVRVGMVRTGTMVRLTVDDRGPGVPPEERRRIWEPYRRLERDARSATGGSGIGLAVVRELVELHGGSVEVHEAPGGGARFVAVLHGARATAVAVDGSERQAVDDDQTARAR